MLHTSEDKNKYVMVMIKHFTKWVELVPISEKSSFYTATALKGVLTRFGAPAEVLTDQGEEFQGEFAALLQKLLIDHQTTSRDHSQSNGLAERMVQVVKEVLRKYCLTFNKQHWCCFLSWIAMGYRMSRQRSLGGYSAYFLLFGRWPIVGTSVRVVQRVVDLDSPAECPGTAHQRACQGLREAHADRVQ
jgi:transposase InsO family protein